MYGLQPLRILQQNNGKFCSFLIIRIKTPEIFWCNFRCFESMTLRVTLTINYSGYKEVTVPCRRLHLATPLILNFPRFRMLLSCYRFHPVSSFIFSYVFPCALAPLALRPLPSLAPWGGSCRSCSLGSPRAPWALWVPRTCMGCKVLSVSYFPGRVRCSGFLRFHGFHRSTQFGLVSWVQWIEWGLSQAKVKVGIICRIRTWNTIQCTHRY